MAATYDGSALRLYVNGTLVGTTPQTGSVAVSTGPLRIGGNSIWGEYYKGLIDEVRVYSRALTQAEIQVDMSTPIGVDNVAPTVGATSPAAGASGVAVNANVTAQFSEAIDPATLTASTFELRDPSNALVPATLAYDGTSRVATLDGVADLALAKTYTARLKGGSSGVKDLAGNPLASDFTWSFTTTATAPLPTLAVSDLVVTEGNLGAVNAVFNVTLSAPSAQAVTVAYATGNGTATAGSDYLPLPTTTLTFAPGQTSLPVTVTVLGDTLFEGNETFLLNLSGPANATIADAQGQATIVDDDVALIDSDGFGYSAFTQAFEPIDLVPGAPGVITIRATGNNNNNAVTLSNGSTFSFYGTTYTAINVSTNGLIALGGSNTSANNTNLTTAPAQRVIAPLWDDWINTTGNAMVLAKYEDTNADGVYDRLIIEWNLVQGAPTSPSPVTFQAILGLNTGGNAGDILFNYPDVDTNDARSSGGSATVGIKDTGSQTINRLLVSFNSSSNPYVGSGQAIRITRNTVAPTVALTGPGGGATLAGTVAVAANASDDVGVAGVQFLLDGAPLGAEDTVAPYALSWDTATSANGPHTLTARARDTAGNLTMSSAVAVTISNAVSTTGLVAAYGFNEGAGATAADVSGHGLSGTLSNATWSTAGRFGNALSFNGTNALVTVADNALLDLTGAMTLEVWVNPAALSGWTTALLKEQAGGLVYSLYASDDTSRPPAGYIDKAGTDYSVLGSSSLALNTWTHLAMTYDGAALRLYVNGALVQTRALTGNITTSNNPLRIGGNSIWGEYFKGLIDEVRVYSRALTQADIQSDMNTPVGGGPGALQTTVERAAAPVALPDLTPAAIRPLVVEATSRWQGASPPGFDLTPLANVPIRVIDLPGSQLAWTSDGTIWLDRDAAGHGWFLDPTPGDDLEFVVPSTQGRIDLLTVLTHEFGHLLGFAHEDVGVMEGTLDPDVRRLPEPFVAPAETSVTPARRDPRQDLPPSLEEDSLTLIATELIEARAKRSRLVSDEPSLRSRGSLFR